MQIVEVAGPNRKQQDPRGRRSQAGKVHQVGPAIARQGLSNITRGCFYDSSISLTASSVSSTHVNGLEVNCICFERVTIQPLSCLLGIELSLSVWLCALDAILVPSA